MAEYFTVDRRSLLVTGAELTLTSDIADRTLWVFAEHFGEAELLAKAQALFPEGLSPHGIHYLVEYCLATQRITGHRATIEAVPHVPTVELTFELVRRLEFPDRPSRFQSWFGWQTLEEAKRFRESHGTPEARIFAIDSPGTFRADMSLLLHGGSNLGATILAARYWSGIAGPHPAWEFVLPQPIRIGEQAA
jgi:hypothetical protein